MHVLLTDDAFREEGEFLQLPYFDPRLVEEVFRRRVLERVHRAERLSEDFPNLLLGWVHSGFSVHGEQTVSTEDVQGADRYVPMLRSAAARTLRTGEGTDLRELVDHRM